MKKITLISACMLLFTVANAEQMQFVTTLSAPVGNFAHLDAADSTHVTTAPILNFCNTRSSVGNIVIKGANAYLKQVNVQNGTTLGSTNTPEYRLSEKLTIENGGTVTAGRIMANNVTFKDTNFHKSNVTNTIYGNDIPVMGGKADNMDISGTARINKSAQNTANLGEELWWDNQYASDYDASGNKKTNGKTYTSFLLKSKNGTAPATECTPGDTRACGSSCCDSKQTCQSDGTWGSCKRGKLYSTHDSYCSEDGESYWCGAACIWSDSSNSCVLYSGTGPCPSLSEALQQGKERCAGGGKTYSWKRDASMDCVFDPSNATERWFCPMASSSDTNGPLNVGSNCSTAANAAKNIWSKGAISVASKQPSDNCLYEGALMYYAVTYGGLSLGAKYSYGCVAYVCEQD